MQCTMSFDLYIDVMSRYIQTRKHVQYITGIKTDTRQRVMKFIAVEVFIYQSIFI